MRIIYRISNLFLVITTVFVIFLVNSSSEINEGDSLPLKRYQELKYEDFRFTNVDEDSSPNNNRRLNKREAAKSVVDAPEFQTNRLQFTAFNRRFKLILKKDTRLVATGFDIEIRYPSSGRPTEHVHDSFSQNYYTGIVEDIAGSYVVCYFEKPSTESSPPLVFAQISIKNEDENAIYYVEPVLNSTNSSSKYIVYKSDDILSEIISNGVFNQTVCQPKYVNQNVSSDSGMLDLDPVLTRQKRQANPNNNDNQARLNANSSAASEAAKKNRCYLALVADHRFYKEIGNSDAKLTSAYLMNVIAAVNTIFLRTEWIMRYEDREDESWTNYGFSVEKIIILKEATTDRLDHYNNANSSVDADKILESFGYDDWTGYCLAHLFTYQNFANSVLGLAYVSSPLGYTLGGICSRATTRSRPYGGMGPFSVNTGLSSYRSASARQGRLLQREAELVTAHEFGHNWGSEHDPMKAECTPASGMGGNFIMYAFSNQGYERNNYNFSPCSINSISEVLKTKSGCFKAESVSYCGNDRVEGLEECDAGFSGRQGLDKCCDYNCKLRQNAVCSDSNHECCKDCQIARAGYKCYSSPNYIECFEEYGYCDGVNKTCPDQKPKPDNTSCYSIDFGRCVKGQCLSLCQQINKNLFQCKCPQQDEKCMICCRQAGSNDDDDCKPIHQRYGNVYKSPLFMSDGRACFDGLCENRICQQRVKDYVSRFWKVIQTVTVSGFVEFMKRNIVGSIIIISLTFWVPFSCCIHFCIDKRDRSIVSKEMSERMKMGYSYQAVETHDDPRNYDLRSRNTQL